MHIIRISIAQLPIVWSARLPSRLLPDLLDTLHLGLLGRETVLDSVGVVCILNAHDLATLVHVVCAAEHGVHLFQHDTLGLRDEEVDKDRKQDVDAGEHVEGIEATFL